ncbi:RNA-binding protein MEX3B-like [Oppia nitens]|uniref:RNA-binding protein MEX3B-like n=1 Tax=Oppia nitens TaxID=1686743 RepID=UPI0023DC9573|nr:RNA-binding protein MEX3B-like [Oppia nitens]
MPASLMYEMDHNVTTDSPLNGNSAIDQRTYQLAIELSRFGLDSDCNETIGGQPFDADNRNKKSQNTTECVPVPSSEHVAEIVGRQGCKIKALRAKTNTYIKTPVRGEEPVFVVTGRKEDVNAAKREILSAAEHFSQIRAQRKSNLNGSIGGPVPNANVPGQTTIQVRVPYRVVGLVVGPKGATIKRIQQQTNTYIITPSREKEPVFEVTGLPDNVETARKEIEAHIAIRTGGQIDSSGNGSDESSSDFSNSPLLNGIDNPFATNTTNGFGSQFKTSTDPFSAFSSRASDTSNNSLITRSTNDIFNFVNQNKLSDIYSLFSANAANGFAKSISSGSYDTDEGIGESPTFDSVGSNGSNTIASSVWPDFSTQRTYISNISPLDRRSSSLDSPITSNTTNTTPSMI